MSDGTNNVNFSGVESLEDLETSQDFKLLMSGHITTMYKSATFLPDIILPLVSVAYETSITFYDNILNQTQIYIFDGQRSITYTFDGVSVTPNIECKVIAQNKENYFSVHECEIWKRRPTYSGLFRFYNFSDSDPLFNGRTERKKI